MLTCTRRHCRLLLIESHGASIEAANFEGLCSEVNNHPDAESRRSQIERLAGR